MTALVLLKPLTLSAAVDAWLAALHAAGKSPLTLAAYGHDLRALCALTGSDSVKAITPALLQRVLATWRQQGLAANTLFGRQNAIRSFCRWGRRERLWSENPADLMDPVKKPDGVPRPFDGSEVARLMALEVSPLEATVRALLFYTGLRVASICNLTAGAYTLDPPQLRAMGKGGRVQVVEVHPALAEVLAAHGAARGPRAPTTRLLLTPQGMRVTPRKVQAWMQAWGQRAGVPGCTPHRARHTFGTVLLEATGDLRLVQEALGHKTITSTQVYTRVSSPRLRAAVGGVRYGA